MNGMETRAVYRGARISARKARLVADAVRGRSVERATEILQFSPQKAAKLIGKTLQSAVANAEHNAGADIDELQVSRIFVDEGRVMKRLRPRARGRADHILKRSCHITVVVSDTR